MWRSLELIPSKCGCPNAKLPRYLYGTSIPKSGKGKKTVITMVTVAGLSAGATIAYGKYDPKFRKVIEDNIPFSDLIFKSLPNWNEPEIVAPSVVPSNKTKEDAIVSNVIKQKTEELKKEDNFISQSKTRPEDSVKQQDGIRSEPASVTKPLVIEDKPPKPSIIEPPNHKLDESVAIQNVVKDLAIKAEKLTKEAVSSQEAAIEALKSHTRLLYEALDSAGNKESSQAFKEVDIASTKEMEAMKIARKKVMAAETCLNELRNEIQKGKANKALPKNSTLFVEEASVISKLEKELKEATSKVATAQMQSQTAAEYRELVDKAREQFKNELQIVLPKYILKNKDQKITEDELNLLIAHAHRRIEHLQKELARQQVTEKHKVQEAIKVQKSEDEKILDARIASEILRHRKKIEAEFQQQLELAEEEFEADLRHQLYRQAAVHADYLQQALHTQKIEIERKRNKELEEKLLHQKGVFISEVSGSMAKLKAIEDHLKARAQLNEAAQKNQALWLACQAMKNTLRSGFSENPKPLGKEIAVIKSSSADESPFVASVLSGIPLQAVERGVFTDEYLKERFNKVKLICKRVAMVDENNRSLYQYLLSYLQSFLIIDSIAIPAAEVENKVAVDPSKWDTFDILSRISFCLQRNDMEQALRYANQLKGEPLNVAKDWIHEVQLLLETSLAVDCLIAYASAISVQVYH